MANEREQALVLVRLRWPRPASNYWPNLYYPPDKRTWMETLPREFLLKEGYQFETGKWSTLSVFVKAETVESRLVDWVMKNPGRI